jgi:hypothetical protein
MQHSWVPRAGVSGGSSLQCSCCILFGCHGRAAAGPGPREHCKVLADLMHMHEHAQWASRLCPGATAGIDDPYEAPEKPEIVIEPYTAGAPAA